MSNPEAPRPDREQRERELQKLDPFLTPEFWERVRQEAEVHWLDKRGLTLEEYELLVDGDEEKES